MHPMRELFSPDRSRGFLPRMDARVKLILTLAVVVGVVASSRAGLPAGVLTACLVMAVASRSPVKLMARRLVGPVGFAVMVCVLRAFMVGKTPLAGFDVGRWHLVMSREGTIEGAMIGLRVMASVSAMLILCAVTPVHEMMAVLKWGRVPEGWVEVAMLMYRYIFALFDQAGSVWAAQKIRMGYGGLGRSLTSMGDLAGVVTLRAIDQADKTHEAMIARGYHGSLHISPLAAMRKRDAVLTIAGVLIVVGALGLTEGWL